jgi:predicted CXXCH cytochrome family protein
LAILLGLALPAFAGQHPVPLDKGIKQEECLACHADKAEGKVVHPAVAMGCFSCHYVRGSGDTTRVVLKTPKSTVLCITCHADKKAGSAKHMHAPVTKDCLRCHDAHVSENKALLKKPMAGDKATNLCLGCHKQGLDMSDKGSRHAAIDAGCDSCHVTHKTGDGDDDVTKFHLTKPSPALCVECHDVADGKLNAAHKGQPFAAEDCTSCHDPHSSKAPKLMQTYLHSPFGDGSCDACHDAAKDGKVKLTQPEVNAVCTGCHSEVGDRIAKAPVQHAGAAGDCTACHNPHAGRFPRFLRPNPVAVCESCHPDQAEQMKTKSVVHDPVGARCAVCHEPHGGERPKLLRANGSNLCLECHGPDASGTKVENTKDVTIFKGSIQVPELYIQQTPHLPLNTAGKGHPSPGHPVSGPDPSRPKQEITCERCHTPHAGDKNLLVVGGASNMPLCSQCHKGMK